MKIIYIFLLIALVSCKKEEVKPIYRTEGYYPVLPQTPPKKKIYIQDIESGKVILQNDSTTLYLNGWTIENNDGQYFTLNHVVIPSGEKDTIDLTGISFSFSAIVTYLKDNQGNTIDYWVTSQH
jgi:hypothetical protein